MGVTCTGSDRVIVMAISGEIDHHRARSIMNQMDEEFDRYLPRVVELDLSGVSFMDSSGIAVVLRCYRRIKEQSGDMTVTKVPAQPGKVLHAAGLHKMIKFE